MGTSRNVERDRAIGARICLARILGAMTRPALGGRIGVSNRLLARYERGETRVPASLLEDLCTVFREEPSAKFGKEPLFFLTTDPDAVLMLETLGLPEPGSVARRHLDQVFAVLGGTVPPGGVPFGSAAPMAPCEAAAA